MQEQVELGVKGKFLISHLDDAGSSSLNDLTRVYGLDGGVNGVFEIFNQNGLALLDTSFEDLDCLIHGLRGKSSDFETVVLLFFFDPSDSL